MFIFRANLYNKNEKIKYIFIIEKNFIPKFQNA